MLDNSPPRVRSGAKILHKLPDQRTCSFLLTRYLESIQELVFSKFTTRLIAASLWSTYDKALREPRRTDALGRISATICKNAESPLSEVDDHEAWHASFLGTNLRWECLGLIFA